MGVGISKRIGIPLSVGSSASSAPVVIGATIEIASQIDILFNKQLNSTLPSLSALNIPGWTINGLSIDGTGFIVSVSVTVPFGLSDTPSISYTQPGSNPLKLASADVLVLSFNKLVANNLLSPPVILDASYITKTEFRANWQGSARATKYYLDISLSSDFSSFLTGYNNKDVGNNVSEAVSGLSVQLDYYYRVRANRGSQYSGYSDTKEVTTLQLSTPTGLNSTTISGIEIDLAWDNLAEATEYILERRVLGGSFAEIATISDGSGLYSDTELATATQHDYRIKASNGVHYSAYSEIKTEWTAMVIPIVSQGTGLGLSRLRFNVSSNAIITIDGNGKFYDDIDGTTGESTTKTLTSSTVPHWVKVTSGSCNILCFFKGNCTGWGDSGHEGWKATDFDSPSCSIAISAIVKTITQLYLAGGLTSTGNTLDLPRGLIFIYIDGLNTLTGDIKDLPPNMIQGQFTGANALYGNLQDLPSTMVFFYAIGNNTIGGDPGLMPSGIIYLFLYGNVRVSDYTAGRVWANNLMYISVEPGIGYGLSSTEVDNMLIDLASATWSTGGLVAITCSPRTSASDAAVATLISKGVTVTTN